MFASGQLRPINSTPVPAIVRYGPLATKMVRHRERGDVHHSVALGNCATVAADGLRLAVTDPCTSKSEAPQA